MKSGILDTIQLPYLFFSFTLSDLCHWNGAGISLLICCSEVSTSMLVVLDFPVVVWVLVSISFKVSSPSACVVPLSSGCSLWSSSWASFLGLVRSVRFGPSCPPFLIKCSLGYFLHAHRIGCLPCGSDGKEHTCNMGDPGLIPGLGRYPWRRE